MQLRSFGFQQQLTGDMLGVLFKDLPNYHGEFDYSLEIIEAALEGRIDIRKDFNLFGYCKVIRDGKSNNEMKKFKKNVCLIEQSDEYAESGVTLESLVDERDDYEIINDNEETMYIVKKVQALNFEMMRDLGIDLIWCIKQAVKGVPQAVEELTNFCTEYSWYSEYVEIILGSGIPIDELFPDEVVSFSRPVEKKSLKVKVG